MTNENANNKEEIVPVDEDRIVNNIKQGFQKFAEGLSNIFEDITSLEVNTMIVSEIQGMKFYPEEAYWFIYNIPTRLEKLSEQQYREKYYEEKKLNENLQMRHMQLRERLMKICQDFEEKSNNIPTPKPYRLPLPDPLFDPNERENIQKIGEKIIKELKTGEVINNSEIEDFLIKLGEIAESQNKIDDLKKELIKKLEKNEDKEIITKFIILNKFRELQQYQEQVDNGALLKLQELQEKFQVVQEKFPDVPNLIRNKEEKRRNRFLKNSEFLLKLRKLNELRALLEGEAASQNNIYDLIYAQTVIQLDGDVMSRFDKKLFEPKEKEIREFLLSIHQGSVISGEENWRDFLRFMKDLVESIANYFNKSK